MKSNEQIFCELLEKPNMQACWVELDRVMGRILGGVPSVADMHKMPHEMICDMFEAYVDHKRLMEVA